MLGDSVRRRLPAARLRRRKPRPEPEGERPTIRWRFWLSLGVLALALPFAVGYFTAARILFPRQTVASPGVPVPRLYGLDTLTAAERVAQLQLGPVRTSLLPSPTALPGEILAQDPLPGQQLPPGGAIAVAVSSGKPHAIVPDVSGFDQGRARELLIRLGFTTDSVTVASDLEAGHVVRTEPVAGMDLELPAAVTLMLSEGPPVLPGDSLGQDTTMVGDTSAAAFPGPRRGAPPGGQGR